MRVMAIGDVVGQVGCDFLRKTLPRLKKEYNTDLVIVNGENSADGNGITPHSADYIFDSGADVITTGNHGLRRREIFDMLDREIGIVRPANFSPECPGCGYYVYDLIRFKVCIINICGQVYMEGADNPFDCVDRILSREKYDIVIVDFHAEATAEKIAMGYHLDGRASLLYGTHTHVQTADERIFKNGLGYITDLGMCGPDDSVLGVKPELALKRLRTHLPVRFETAKSKCRICGIVADIDENTGKTVKIERINIVEN